MNKMEDDPYPASFAATYRLQFHKGFTFAQAKELVSYLDTLGISHCYASPYLKARAGSIHGYDIVDHKGLNPEIGTAEEYDDFVAALHHHGMGQILDVVPNHMGIMGSDNRWWLDVLENGRASVYANFFDIDWTPAKTELNGKVLVPVLGDQYGVLLENGELVLKFDAERGELSVWYYNHRFPIDPREYPRVLLHRIEALAQRLGEDHTRLLEFRSLATAFSHLPESGENSTERMEERHRDKEINKRRLVGLCRDEARIKTFIEENVELFNGRPGNLDSFHLLHDLLETQPYRLAHWRAASDEINYRRFFDINDLAGLRMEDERVFDATHELILNLVAQGKLQGLRIDHPDGLYDPRQYYQRLRQRSANLTEAENGPLYIVAEKILASYEHLPHDWPIQGTIGYEFASIVNGLFVDANAERTMTQIYEQFIGKRMDFDDVVYQSKRRIMKVGLASGLNVLANRLNRISEAEPKTRDFTLIALRDALREIVARFPVYRTYIVNGQMTEDDRQYVDWATSLARKYSAAADTSVFEFIRRVLLLEAHEGLDEAQRRTLMDFTMRFQQYTAPVMAKGVEDTAFYIYNRLVSLNEVGSDPRRFGASVSAFHHHNIERFKRFPRSLLSTSTHDTKRAEDVRARINVLSEIPQQWKTHLTWWSRLNRIKKTKLNGDPAPSRNDEYLFYQTLVGTWPLTESDDNEWHDYVERIERYMLKAAREAKVHTAWTNPHLGYEEALIAFVRAALSRGEKNRFVKEFQQFQRRVVQPGLYNGLAQCLLKLTAPGIPDIYQGTELWDFSLVDPDNRRPVDYGVRRALLNQVRGDLAVYDEALPVSLKSLMNTMADGRIKLYLIWRTLDLRRHHAALFAWGDYVPLSVEGPRAENLVAFARIWQSRTVVVVAPRLFTALISDERPYPIGEPWLDTWLEIPAAYASKYFNVFTGEALYSERRGDKQWLSAAAALRHFPVALVVNE